MASLLENLAEQRRELSALDRKVETRFGSITDAPQEQIDAIRLVASSIVYLADVIRSKV